MNSGRNKSDRTDEKNEGRSVPGVSPDVNGQCATGEGELFADDDRIQFLVDGLYSPTHHFTNSPTHQLTNSPTHQLTNSHSGMFPCFFGGFLSRLFARFLSAVISFARVSRGSITSSRKPRPAATYGFANFSRNSATFSA